MVISIESIRDHIPAYLNEDLKRGLAKELASFPEKFNYYTQGFDAEALQGDGWTGFCLINEDELKEVIVRGIILSNSCDIDPSNERDRPGRVVFAPMVRLERTIALWKESGISEAIISNKLSSIRSQKNTRILYLPAGGSLDGEFIVHLDDVHSVKLDKFFREAEKVKIFTLSQAGFYLFLLKLSVHFCRFHEDINRNETRPKT